jgi:hypothetical protein
VPPHFRAGLQPPILYPGFSVTLHWTESAKMVGLEPPYLATLKDIKKLLLNGGRVNKTIIMTLKNAVCHATFRIITGQITTYFPSQDKHFANAKNVFFKMINIHKKLYYNCFQIKQRTKEQTLAPCCV